MWLLISRSDPGKKYVLVGGKKYVVGRQNSDITIADASVSRNQAELSVYHHETNVMKSFVTPRLSLRDVSKFGTFVNGKCVRNMPSQATTLQEGDEIKFGGSPLSVYSVTYEPFIMTTSCIEKAPKKDLINWMCLLGGHVVREWRPNCEMLIMSKVNVTIKVVCALNSQKHIVTPSYLEDLYAFYLGKKDKPDPMNYLPEVVDQEVPPGVSFHPDERRKSLLTGLKVYFLSAVQFNKTNLAVSTAGGQPILLEDGTEEDAETMTQDRTVVISVNKDILATLSQHCQKFVKLVFTTLAAKNLRMISDPEVGWAILTCNIEKFCNPTSEITPSMYADVASQMTQLSASQICPSDDVSIRKRSFPAHKDESSEDLIEHPPPKRLRGESEAPNSSRDLSSLETSRSVNQSNLSTSVNDKANTSKSMVSQQTSVNDKANTSKSMVSQQKESENSSRKPDLASETKSETSRVEAGGQKSSRKRTDSAADSDENDNMLNPRKADKPAAPRLSTDLFSDPSDQLPVPSGNSSGSLSAGSSTSSAVVFKGNVTPPSNVQWREERRMARSPRPMPHLSDLNDSAQPNATGMSASTLGDKEDVKPPSVFARTGRVTRSPRPVGSCRDDSDGEETIVRKGKPAAKRKVGLFSLSDDEDEKQDCSARKVKSTKLSDDGKASKSSKTMNDEISPHVDDNDESEETENSVFRNNQKGASRVLQQTDDSDEIKINQEEPLAQKANLQSGTGSTGWLNVASETRIKPEPLDQSQTHPLGGGHSDVSEVPTEADDPEEMEQDEKKDVKPVLEEDQDLLLDNEGRPLKHFCEVKVVSLLARPIGSQRERVQHVPATKGMKNFKKFRKTKHPGSDRMPTIIGGRDLEVYTGDRHRDIEHLFSMELEEENKREEEERTARRLFDWDREDNKSKKTATKRAR